MEEELIVTIVIRKTVASTLDGKNLLNAVKANHASDENIVITGNVSVRFVDET